MSEFNSRHGVARQAIVLSAASAAAQVLTALLYAYVARMSSPSEFGQSVAAIAAGTALVGIVDFGSNTYWVRELARGGLGSNEVASRALTKLCMLAPIGIAASVFLAIAGNEYWATSLVCLATLANQAAQVFLRGSGHADKVAASILLERALAAILVVVLSLAGQAASVALPSALVIGALGAATLSYFLGRPRGSRKIWLRLNNPWHGSAHFGLGVAAQTASSFDIPLLSLAAGPAAAGVYGAVNRWTQPMSLLATAFSAALIPYVAHVGSLRTAITHARRALWMLFAAMGVCVAMILFAQQIVVFVVGPKFIDSADVLRILALATLLGLVNQPLSGALQAIQLEKPVARIIVGSVFVQLALVVVLGALLGAVGAAVAYLVLQIGLVVSFSFVAWRARGAIKAASGTNTRESRAVQE